VSSEHKSDPPKTPPAGPGYEVRDANIKALLQFALGLAVLLAVTLVAMRFTFSYLDKMTPLGPAASPFENSRQIPSGPLLQVKPHQELNDYCSGQRDAVNNYAWVNQSGGVVQLPIDRAMDVTLQHGLASRSADEMAAAGATIPQLGAAGEPDATYLQGPCGYLQQPAAAAAVPTD
jgi:hypothetical protein